MKVNNPSNIPILTKGFDGGVGKQLSNFKTKHEMGFNDSEIDSILKKNKLSRQAFNHLLYGQTYTKIDGDDVYYYGDVIRAFNKLIDLEI